YFCSAAGASSEPLRFLRGVAKRLSAKFAIARPASRAAFGSLASRVSLKEKSPPASMTKLTVFCGCFTASDMSRFSSGAHSDSSRAGTHARDEEMRSDCPAGSAESVEEDHYRRAGMP